MNQSGGHVFAALRTEPARPFSGHRNDPWSVVSLAGCGRESAGAVLGSAFHGGFAASLSIPLPHFMGEKWDWGAGLGLESPSYDGKKD